jgi:F420-non-reducing hydrogenase iron-sulfur subunit
MCTGRIDPAFIFQAFSNGADGVYIGGCWPGECHYVTEGNYHALGMTLLYRKLLKYVGINPERLRLEWLGASEGIRFAEVMNDVSGKIKALGPLGSSEGTDGSILRHKLEAVKNLLPYIKLVERERLRVPVASVEEYNQFFAGEDVEKIIRELIIDKLEINRILSVLREGPLSSEEISARLGLDLSDVVKYTNSSERQGFLKTDERKKFMLPPGLKEQARA